MATKTEFSTQQEELALSKDQLLQMYYQMLLARKVDECAWALHRQGKVAFHISGMGQEACQVAAAHAIRVGYDFVHSHYRDLALVLGMGITPTEFFMSMWGKKGDTLSGGRQMPSHWSARRVNLLSLSSPVADHVPQAAGIALAEKIKRETGIISRDEPIRVTLVNLGEGATSMGDWHEGLNWAGVHKLPMVCMVENNKYAISVPMHKQMAVKSVADRAAAYGIEGIAFDGNDVIESYSVLKYAIDKARAGQGPTLLEAKTDRLVPNMSNNETSSEGNNNDNRANDPLVRFTSYLSQRGILGQERIDELNERVNNEVKQALYEAETAPLPAPEDAMGGVYAP